MNVVVSGMIGRYSAKEVAAREDSSDTVWKDIWNPGIPSFPQTLEFKDQYFQIKKSFFEEIKVNHEDERENLCPDYISSKTMKGVAKGRP